MSLANTGNFSQSAEDRNITQSAFSRRIQALEIWLDTELVDRKKHPVKLTDEGIRFLATAKSMIQLADNIQQDFSDKKKATAHQTIAFSSSTNLAISFLPAWLDELRHEFGNFKTTVQTDVSGIHDHFERLQSKKSDFLLHCGHGVEMLAMDASKYEHITVGHDVLVPVCHHSLLPEMADVLTREDGRPVPYLSPWKNSAVANTIASKIAESNPGARLDALLESSILGCTKGFVAAAAGVAWLAETLIEKELESGDFARIAGTEFDIPLSIQLYRYSPTSTPIATRFWDHVASKYSRTG